MAFSSDNCAQWSDHELVRRSLQDLNYFSCLFERYEPSLLRYVQNLGFPDQEEAADVLQEAFIKIWKNLNDFDDSQKWSSWMYRIVHNQAISCLRKKKSWNKNQVVGINENLSKQPSETRELEDLELLEKQDHKIHWILDHLPLKYREVLVLKFLENKSYEEISDILKIPEGTVGTRINRAKKAFREKAGRDPIFSF